MQITFCGKKLPIFLISPSLLTFQENKEPLPNRRKNETYPIFDDIIGGKKINKLTIKKNPIKNKIKSSSLKTAPGKYII